MTEAPHEYDPTCPDCVPMIIDVDSQSIYPKDHPLMVEILRRWALLPVEARAAYMRFTSSDRAALADVLASRPAMLMIQSVLSGREEKAS